MLALSKISSTFLMFLEFVQTKQPTIFIDFQVNNFKTAKSSSPLKGTKELSEYHICQVFSNHFSLSFTNRQDLLKPTIITLIVLWLLQKNRARASRGKKGKRERGKSAEGYGILASRPPS